MQRTSLSKSTLGRLPLYLHYLEAVQSATISATTIARDLQLGEVQVRKDLSCVSPRGRPKSGYPTQDLRTDLAQALGNTDYEEVIVVGTAPFGPAWFHRDDFETYGLKITAAFDTTATQETTVTETCPVYPMDQLAAYCECHHVHVGILAVPDHHAQALCTRMVDSGITVILSFSTCRLQVPAHVTLQQENVALSLAYLKLRSQMSNMK